MSNAHPGLLTLVAIGVGGCQAEEVMKNKTPALNHAYVVVDTDSYAQLESSAALKDLAFVEERTTTSESGATYSGLYLVLEKTYLEFLRMDSLGGQEIDNCGFAVSPDDQGAFTALPVTLARASIPSTLKMVTRRDSDSYVPWFYSLTPERYASEQTWFQFWIMGYHPEFLQEWHHDMPPYIGVDRESVLRKYKTVIGRSDPRVLKDITAMTFRLDADEIRYLRRCLSALGWSEETNESTLTLHHGDTAIHLTPYKNGRRGLLGLEFSTHGTTAKVDVRCGEVRILIEDGRGYLSM